MKKTRRLVATLLIITLMLSMTQFALAMESPTSFANSSGSESFEMSPRIPGWDNIVRIGCSYIGDKITVSIQNIGLDWVDLARCRVRIFTPTGIQYDQVIIENNIAQFFPRNTDLYVKGWTRVVISDGYAEDEGDFGTFAGLTVNR